MQKLKELYPDLVYADVCIGFGNFATGGTVDVNGKMPLVYIGLEYHGLDSSTITSEFRPAMKDYLSRSNFFRTLIHKHIHVQQQTHGSKVSQSFFGNKLIHSVLREGIPDFIAKLIYPAGNDGNYVNYGLLHEKKLMEKLQEDMWSGNKSYWIYNSDAVIDQPRDLGYFMGARIGEAFYIRNKKKKDVVKQLIEIKNIEKFIEQSGYFD